MESSVGFDPVSFARLFVGATFGILGVGVSAYGFIDAAYAYGNAQRLNSELKATLGRDACSAQGANHFCRMLDRSRERTDESLVMGFGGLALTAAAGAVLVYEFGRQPLPGHEAGVRLRAAVVAAPGGGAVTISGSF